MIPVFFGAMSMGVRTQWASLTGYHTHTNTHTHKRNNKKKNSTLSCLLPSLLFFQQTVACEAPAVG